MASMRAESSLLALGRTRRLSLLSWVEHLYHIYFTHFKKVWAKGPIAPKQH